MKLTLNQRSKLRRLLDRISSPEARTLDALGELRQTVDRLAEHLQHPPPALDLSPLTFVLSDLSNVLRRLDDDRAQHEVLRLLSLIAKREPPSHDDLLDALKTLTKTVEESAKKRGQTTVLGGTNAFIQDRKTFTAGQDTVSPGAGVFNDSLTDLTAGMGGALRMTKQRAQHVNLRDSAGTEITLAQLQTDGGSGKTLRTAKFSLTATGQVIAAVTGKRLKVYAVKLVVSAAISVKWRNGATTDLEDLQPYAANGGYTESVNPPAFLFATSAGNRLDLVISGTGTAAGRVSYWDDDAS